MKFQEMNESEKVEALVKIGVPVEEAKKAVTGSQQIELTESHKPAKEIQLTEAQQVELEKIGKHLTDWKIKKPLVRAYRKMGLTAQEAYIAAGVETRLSSLSEADFAKFSF
jgi:hypothetical protein